MDGVPSLIFPRYQRGQRYEDEDSDDETINFDWPERAAANSQDADIQAPPEREVIDLEDFENEYDATIDLTKDDDDEDVDVVLQRFQSASLEPGQPFGASGRQLGEFICRDGLVVKEGTTVELSEPIVVAGISAPFLKVTMILDDGDGGAILRGIPLARNRDVKGMLARKINEVCILVVVDITGKVPCQDVPATRIVRVRDLRVTNSEFPHHRYDTSDFSRRGRDWVLTHSPLVCRWRFVQIFETRIARMKNAKPVEWELVRIQEDEADEKYRERAELLVNKWRGGIIPGGSFKASSIEVPFVDLDASKTHGRQQPGRIRLPPRQQYTAGDTFAGAGGASRGMELAGARLVFAVDHWDAAAKSLKANFVEGRTAEESSTVHEMDIFGFVNAGGDINPRVDLLHLSPPCQVWSPAHTTRGQNDEVNEAALWSCTHLIEKVRPRLFTVEQTFGILAPRFRAHFGLFLAGFTDHGYSIRWKVIHLKTFGLAQPRRRVIIFGAGPGEKLPPFPPPTHAEGGEGGLKPFTTARQALRSIGRNAGNDPLHIPRLFDRPRTPWNPNGLLLNTMTCGGGQNYHWSGTRDFTLREYSLLQGFPNFHKFEAPAIKKQIGNAFPPSVVKVFYKHLIAWLDKTDGFDPSSRPTPGIATLFGAQAGVRAIELLDDDDDADAEVTCIRAVPRKRARAGGHLHSDRRPKRVAHIVISDDEEDDDVFYSSDSFPPMGRRRNGRGSGSGAASSGSSSSSPASRGSNGWVTPGSSPPEMEQPEFVRLRGDMEHLSVEGSRGNPVVI